MLSRYRPQRVGALKGFVEEEATKNGAKRGSAEHEGVDRLGWLSFPNWPRPSHMTIPDPLKTLSLPPTTVTHAYDTAVSSKRCRT